MSTEAKCPFHQTAGGGTSNEHWWPNQLRVDLLGQHSNRSNPLDAGFDYAEAFKGLDYHALKRDLRAYFPRHGVSARRLHRIVIPGFCA